MKCAKCGAELTDGAKFCGKCGTAVPQTLTCPACGKEVAIGSEFCPHCGQNLHAEATPESGTQKNSRKRLMIIAGAVLLAVIIAVVLIIVLGGGSKEPELMESGTCVSEDRAVTIRYETYRDPASGSYYSMVYESPSVDPYSESSTSGQNPGRRVEGIYTPPAGYIVIDRTVYVVIQTTNPPETTEEPKNYADQFTGVWRIESGELAVDKLRIEVNSKPAEKDSLLVFKSGQYVSVKRNSVDRYNYRADAKNIEIWMNNLASLVAIYHFESSPETRLTLETAEGTVVLVPVRADTFEGVAAPEIEKQFERETVLTCEDMERSQTEFFEPIRTYRVFTHFERAQRQSTVENEYRLTAAYDALRKEWAYEKELQHSVVNWGVQPGTYTDIFSFEKEPWIHISYLDGNTVVVDDASIIEWNGEKVNLAGTTFHLNDAETTDFWTYYQVSKSDENYGFAIRLSTDNDTGVTLCYPYVSGGFDYNVILSRTGD